jgi:predicted TIM-barrel fold metal-dependent hydrolase
MYGFYELIASCGLFLVFHSGYDMANPGNTQADVERIKKIADWFKDLTIVCTHVGGWKQWERIGCLSSCANVHTETSMTLTEVGDEEFIRLIDLFGEDRVLFGSDSPWTDQQEMLNRTAALKISEARKEKLLYKNAANLLKLP